MGKHHIKQQKKWRAAEPWRPGRIWIVWLVLGAAVAASFMGVQPLASYKDHVTDWISPKVEAARQTLFPTDEEIKAGIFNLTNAARVKDGLLPLVELSELDAVAQSRALHMAETGRLEHAYSLKGEYRTENIAEGYRNPQFLVEDWLRSRGHSANILDPDFKHTGIGYVDGWACQVFR